MKPLHRFDIRRSIGRFISVVLALLAICMPQTSGAWTALEALGLKGIEDYIEISVEFDAECSTKTDFPIRVTLVNNYNQSISFTRFHIFGRIDGYSGSKYYTDRPYSTDRIIEPSRAFSSCWRIPGDYIPIVRDSFSRFPPAEMVWSGEIDYVTTD